MGDRTREVWDGRAHQRDAGVPFAERAVDAPLFGGVLVIAGPRAGGRARADARSSHAGFAVQRHAESDLHARGGRNRRFQLDMEERAALWQLKIT